MNFTPHTSSKVKSLNFEPYYTCNKTWKWLKGRLLFKVVSAHALSFTFFAVIVCIQFLKSFEIFIMCYICFIPPWKSIFWILWIHIYDLEFPKKNHSPFFRILIWTLFTMMFTTCYETLGPILTRLCCI